MVQTISCIKNGLSYNKIVKTIVSSNYCFYHSLLRPKSLSMPYSCSAYTLYGSPALQGWER